MPKCPEYAIPAWNSSPSDLFVSLDADTTPLSATSIWTLPLRLSSLRKTNYMKSLSQLHSDWRLSLCSWRFNQPFTSLWMNSRFTCKRTCRGTRPNGFARGPVLTQRQRKLGDSLLNSFSAPTETNAYLSPLIFSLGVDSGMVSGRLAPIDILRIFSIGTPLFLKRTSSWVISSSF